MSNQATLTLTSDRTSQDLKDRLVNTNPNAALSSLRNYMDAVVSGSDSMSLNVLINTGNAVAASGTLTCASVASSDTAVVNGVTVTAVDKREKTDVTCVADVAGSLNNTYIVFFSGANVAKYAMWYNINSAGTPPIIAGVSPGNLIEVDGATNVSAANIAAASRAKFALSPLLTDFTESGATTHIIFQAKVIGVTTATADTGITGFTISESIVGGTVSAVQFQIGSDTVTASNLSTALNAQAGISPFVTASPSSGIVTVTAVQPGISGNTITISGSGGVAASAARLASGVADTSSVSYNFHR